MTRLRVGDYTASVETFGSGARPALALHCGLGRAAGWTGLGTALGDLVTITAPDLPGHGKSDPWPVGRDGFSQTALALAHAAMPGGGPVDLIGHSWGGVLALALGVAHPGRIRSLTLYEPVFFALARHAGRAEFAENEARSRPFIEGLETGDWALAAERFITQWGGGVPWDALPEAARADITTRVHTVAAGHDLLHDDAGTILRPGGLEALRAPVLLLSGPAPLPVIAAINEELAARLPNAHRVLLDQGGHMAPVTRAGAVGRVVRGFLEGV